MSHKYVNSIIVNAGLFFQVLFLSPPLGTLSIVIFALLSIIRDSFNKIQAGRNRIFFAQSLLKAIALIVFSIELLSTGTIGVFSYSVEQSIVFQQQ